MIQRHIQPSRKQSILVEGPKHVMFSQYFFILNNCDVTMYYVTHPSFSEKNKQFFLDFYHESKFMKHRGFFVARDSFSVKQKSLQTSLSITTQIYVTK